MAGKKAGLNKVIEEVSNELSFSGVVYMKHDDEVVSKAAYGYANRSEKLSNSINTRFGIASGCKLFTAIAICQLVQGGRLSFNDRLQDILVHDFQHFSDDVTVHHLLTHTSGIPDYFDEEVMDDFEELWVKYPMYTFRELKDFLPLFQYEQMKSTPGEKFHYNNAGFILLGLIVEQVSELTYQDYVGEFIFKKAEMDRSGFFAFESLPSNAALGYIDNQDGTWRTNIYSLPVKGGSDGGAYTTAPDMIKLWESLFNHRLLSEEYTNKLLHSHVVVEEEVNYGYGIWVNKRNGTIFKYHLMGYDPGVSFRSSIYPNDDIKLVILSNKEYGPSDVTKAIENYFTGR